MTLLTPQAVAKLDAQDMRVIAQSLYFHINVLRTRKSLRAQIPEVLPLARKADVLSRDMARGKARRRPFMLHGEFPPWVRRIWRQLIQWYLALHPFEKSEVLNHVQRRGRI